MGNEDIFRRFTCWDDQYRNPYEYYTKRAQRLIMTSPARDGTNQQLILSDPMADLKKVDANITVSTTGAWNAMYDLNVFTYFSTQADVLGALKQEPWKRHGYRAVTAASRSSGLGVADGATRRDTVASTYEEVAPTPKIIEHTFGITELMFAVYPNIMDAIQVPDVQKTEEAVFWRSLAADILQDNDTLASNNFESIDRICGSYSEITGVGQDANDLDIYGKDRDAAATNYDANVLHASGVDRTLSIALIDQLLQNQREYWDKDKGVNNKWYLTNNDTWTRWSEIEAAKQRWGNEKFAMTVGDGIKTWEGTQGGFKLATWDGIPIIVDPSVQSDTISRIYLLDNDHLGISWGRPIQYVEAGRDPNDLFVVGHNMIGAWTGIGELYATKFKVHGKLRDLK